MADIVAGAAQLGLEPSLRHPDAQFLTEQDPGLDDGPGLVDKDEVAPQFIFPQMCQQDVGLPGPGPQQAMNPAKPRRTGLPVKLFQNPQAGVAPGMDHVLRLVGPAGDDQRLVHALCADRGLDAVVFGVLCAPRIALVDLDTCDLHLQGSRHACLIRRARPGRGVPRGSVCIRPGIHFST